MKQCSQCGDLKPLTSFNAKKTGKGGLAAECKACVSKRNKQYRENNKTTLSQTGKQWREQNKEYVRFKQQEWYQNNREKVKRDRYQYLYGLSWETTVEMLKSQSDGCAICHSNLELQGRENLARVDHNHKCCPHKSKTCGKCVRGLLCCACNRGLGVFGENIDRLYSTVNYLTQSEFEYTRVVFKGNFKYKDITKTEYDMMRNHGLGAHDFQKLLNRSDGCCEVCGVTLTFGNRAATMLCIDHHHGNKKVRGLLCFKCNTGIGCFKDDIVIINEAIRYLEKGGCRG